MKCEHCGTELPERVWDGYKYMGHYVEIDHTHERCRNTIKAALDEVMLEPRGTVADHWRERAHAAERREAERKGSRSIICGAPNHPSHGGKCGHENLDVCIHVVDSYERMMEAMAKLAEAERERDQLKREYLCAECQHNNARAERFKVALDVIAAREWDKDRDRSVQIALAALAQSADAPETSVKTRCHACDSLNPGDVGESHTCSKTSEPLVGPKALCALCLTRPATTISQRRELDRCAVCSRAPETKEGP